MDKVIEDLKVSLKEQYDGTEESVAWIEGWICGVTDPQISRLDDPDEAKHVLLNTLHELTGNK